MINRLRQNQRLGRLLAVVVVVVAAAPSAALSQDIPCQQQIAQLINEHGQFLNTFADIRMTPYSWGAEGSSEISGWRFSGIPPECTGGMAGTVVASLWANCSVTDIYTTGNCRIPGIRDGWY